MVYDLAFWTTGEGGNGKLVLEVGVLADDAWLADRGATWAGEDASQTLPKTRPVATATKATENMEREDGEFMLSPTNPIP